MRYQVNLEDMRKKCDRLQWRASDIDWDAPGRELTTAKVRPMLIDVYWIETVASLVFAGMAQQTAEPELKAIFDSFAKDEQRHAEAELLLLRRWGMVGPNEFPQPNVNARNLIATLEREAHRVHPAVYAAVIPMTELVLDGALVREMTRQVDDPVSEAVFNKINADEARHLAMDFYLLERWGSDPSVADNWGFLMDHFLSAPRMFGLLFGYMPLLARARPNCELAGIDHAKVTECFARYSALGKNSEAVSRHPMFKVSDHVARKFSKTGKTRLGDALLYLSDIVDAAGVRPYV